MSELTEKTMRDIIIGFIGFAIIGVVLFISGFLLGFIAKGVL